MIRVQTAGRFMHNRPLGEHRMLRACLPLAVAAFGLFVCFWQLGAQSISSGDESIHVRVVQSMIENKRWVSPTLEGQLYFGKPPFKLLLSKLVVMVLGQSNFAFRALDGLAGFCTIMLTYVLGGLLFRSGVIGAVAALLLATNHSFIFEHVVREAVQDSMLVLLSTAALTLGWKLTEEVFRDDASPDRSRCTRLGVAIGALVGLAVLTKSIGGFFPLVVLYCAWLMRGRISRVVSVGLFIALLPALCATVIASLYFCLNILCIPGSAHEMITVNLHERLLGRGFHHTKQWYFYAKLLFSSSRVIPVGLLAVGLLAGILGCVRRHHGFQFVVSWAVIPVVGYSALSSRLPWYIAPAFPAIALLSAAGLVKTLSLAARRAGNLACMRKGGTPLSGTLLQAACGVAFLGISVYAAYTVGLRAENVVGKLLQPRGPSAIELLTREMHTELQRPSGPKKVALYGLSDALDPMHTPFNLQKKVYLSQISEFSEVVEDSKQLAAMRQNGSLAFVITSASSAKELMGLLRPCAVQNLPSRNIRSAREQWSWPDLALLAFTHCERFSAQSRIARYRRPYTTAGETD